MEIDPKDIVNIRIDRRRKFPVTILFKAFGYTNEDILSFFYQKEHIVRKDGILFKAFNPDNLKRNRASFDILDPGTGEVVVKKGGCLPSVHSSSFRQRALNIYHQ